MENHDLVEVIKGIVDQFRETFPLLDLNRTGHAENPRGWCVCTLADFLERDGYGMTPISRLIVATRPDT